MKKYLFNHIYHGAAFLVGTLSIIATLQQPIHAGIIKWDGGTSGTGTSWSSAANWFGDTIPVSTDDVVFDSRTGGGAIVSPMSVSGARTFRTITFDANLPAALQIDSNGSGGSTARTLTLLGDGTSLITLTANATGTVQFRGNNGSLNIALGGSGEFKVTSGTGKLQIDVPVTETGGARSITKTGSGTLTLNGANTYTGNSTLSAGTVNLGSAESVNVSGPLGKQLANAAGSIVLNGGTLQYSAANQNDYSGRFSTAASQAYNVDTAGQNVTWATALTSSGGTLSKSGAGTLTLGANNTYDGGTTLSTGTLKLGVADALGTGGFGFAGGTLDGNDKTDNTIGALTMTASSTLAFHPGTTSTLTFDSATATIGTILTITGWSGTANTPGTDDRLFITADPGATFLSQIHFSGYADGAAWLSLTGEVVPVPEPTTWAMIAFGVIFGAVQLVRLYRRHLAAAC